MLPGLWACPRQSQGMDTDSSPLEQWRVLRQCRGTPDVPGARVCPSVNTFQAEAQDEGSRLSEVALPPPRRRGHSLPAATLPSPNPRVSWVPAASPH